MFGFLTQYVLLALSGITFDDLMVVTVMLIAGMVIFLLATNQLED